MIIIYIRNYPPPFGARQFFDIWRSRHITMGPQRYWVLILSLKHSLSAEFTAVVRLETTNLEFLLSLQTELCSPLHFRCCAMVNKQLLYFNKICDGTLSLGIRQFTHTHTETHSHTQPFILPVRLSCSLTAATTEITAGQHTQAHTFCHGRWIHC